MILLYNKQENQYVVSIGNDVCMHPRKDKATDFKTEELAKAYKDKWDLWDWDIMNGDKIL